MSSRKGPKKAAPKTPSVNGDSKPAKKRRAPRAARSATIADVLPDGGIVSEQPAADPAEYAPGNSTAPVGRLASAIPERQPRWLIPDLIAYSTLTFVVGDQGRGKSSMGAWLCSQAKRPVILPGREEDIEVMLVSRLRANLVDLGACLILDQREWLLPGDKGALENALREHGADLLWIDPVDTYLAGQGQMDEEGVRRGLESLVEIASRRKMAVVAARHPGKAPGNWCPGTRAWRTVPKVILVITQDDGPPVRRFLRAWKPGYGVGAQPREYTLLGEPGEPKRFTLGQEVSQEDADVVATYDPVERTMLAQAEVLLQRVLCKGRVDSAIVRKHAEMEGLKDGILRRAARRLGYEVEREGTGLEHKSYWLLPHSVTQSLRLSHPQWFE